MAVEAHCGVHIQQPRVFRGCGGDSGSSSMRWLCHGRVGGEVELVLVSAL